MIGSCFVNRESERIPRSLLQGSSMGTRPVMCAVMKKSRTRKYIVLALLVVTPAGFLFKFYSGPAQWWFNNYGAGLSYEVFWILIGCFFWPKKEPANKIALCVFIGTSILEVLQLWHPWHLEKIRSYFLGRALIGTSFTW